MSTGRDTALAYLRRDPALYANLLEVLRRGSGRLLYAGEDGVVLYDTGCGAYMLSARPGAEDRLLSLLPAHCDSIVAHETSTWQRALERWHFAHSQICFSAAYLSCRPLHLAPFRGQLRPLTPDLAPWVFDHYGLAFGGVDHIRKAIRRGMLGLYPPGEDLPAGFVGFHDEGSIGMLEVLPPFRRRGCGLVLLQAAVNLALERGSLPFGQIFHDNAPSLALHRKAGFTLSRSHMVGLFHA